MNKKKLLDITAVVLFIAALGLLTASMITHAVFGDKSPITVILAVSAACGAFAGFIMVLLKGKGDLSEDK